MTEIRDEKQERSTAQPERKKKKKEAKFRLFKGKTQHMSRGKDAKTKRDESLPETTERGCSEGLPRAAMGKKKNRESGSSISAGK